MQNSQPNPEETKRLIEKIKRFGFLFIVFIIFGDTVVSFLWSLVSGGTSMELFSTLLLIAFIVVLVSIRQINQYERGVKFTIGKFSSIMEPGWRLVVPIFQS